jgi:hypothetical protein
MQCVGGGPGGRSSPTDRAGLPTGPAARSPAARWSAHRFRDPPRRDAYPLPAHRRRLAHLRCRWSLSRMPTGACSREPKRNASARLYLAPPRSPPLLIAANRRRGRVRTLAFGAVDVGLRGELHHCRAWQLEDVVPHGALGVQRVHVVHRARWVIPAAAVGANGRGVLHLGDDVAFRITPDKDRACRARSRRRTSVETCFAVSIVGQSACVRNNKVVCSCIAHHAVPAVFGPPTRLRVRQWCSGAGNATGDQRLIEAWRHAVRRGRPRWDAAWWVEVIPRIGKVRPWICWRGFRRLDSVCVASGGRRVTTRARFLLTGDDWPTRALDGVCRACRRYYLGNAKHHHQGRWLPKERDCHSWLPHIQQPLVHHGGSLVRSSSQKRIRPAVQADIAPGSPRRYAARLKTSQFNGDTSSPVSLLWSTNGQ